jgi:hypothetical protein
MSGAIPLLPHMCGEGQLYQNALMNLGIYNLLKIKLIETEKSICNANKSERIGYGPLAASSDVNS